MHHTSTTVLHYGYGVVLVIHGGVFVPNAAFGTMAVMFRTEYTSVELQMCVFFT